MFNVEDPCRMWLLILIPFPVFIFFHFSPFHLIIEGRNSWWFCGDIRIRSFSQSFLISLMNFLVGRNICCFFQLIGISSSIAIENLLQLLIALDVKCTNVKMKFIATIEICSVFYSIKKLHLKSIQCFQLFLRSVKCHC